MSGRAARDRPLHNPQGTAPRAIRASGPRTPRIRSRCSGRPDRWCRTRNCTATATSASWTEPAIPEELIEEAVRLGLDGAGHHRPRRLLRRLPVRRGRAAYDLRTIYGAELSLGLTTPQNGVADPEGSICWCWPAGSRATTGWPGRSPRPSCAVTRRGAPLYDLEELAEPRPAGHWTDPDRLPQGRGPLRRWSPPVGPRRPPSLDRLTALFGHDHVVVELIDHGLPTDSMINDALAIAGR